MGVSTNAILAFGFDLGKDLPEAWSKIDDFDFESVIAEEQSVRRPTEEYNDASKDAYHTYWDKRRKAVVTHPTTLITHCSSDYPMYFLAVNGTSTGAARGYPECIEPSKLQAVTPSQVEALKAFCQRHGIAWKEPGWHLFSYWG